MDYELWKVTMRKEFYDYVQYVLLNPYINLNDGETKEDKIREYVDNNNNSKCGGSGIKFEKLDLPQRDILIIDNLEIENSNP